MAQIGGKYFDSLEEELVAWAAQYQLDMQNELTRDHPYGSQPITAQEQVMRFTEMVPEDYVKVVAMLNEKYRGFPDAYDRVNTDLAAFLSDMIAKAAGVL